MSQIQGVLLQNGLTFLQNPHFNFQMIMNLVIQDDSGYINDGFYQVAYKNLSSIRLELFPCRIKTSNCQMKYNFQKDTHKLDFYLELYDFQILAKEVEGIEGEGFIDVLPQNEFFPLLEKQDQIQEFLLSLKKRLIKREYLNNLLNSELVPLTINFIQENQNQGKFQMRNEVLYATEEIKKNYFLALKLIKPEKTRNQGEPKIKRLEILSSSLSQINSIQTDQNTFLIDDDEDQGSKIQFSQNSKTSLSKNSLNWQVPQNKKKQNNPPIILEFQNKGNSEKRKSNYDLDEPKNYKIPIKQNDFNKQFLQNNHSSNALYQKKFNQQSNQQPPQKIFIQHIPLIQKQEFNIPNPNHKQFPNDQNNIFQNRARIVQPGPIKIPRIDPHKNFIIDSDSSSEEIQTINKNLQKFPYTEKSNYNHRKDLIVSNTTSQNSSVKYEEKQSFQSSQKM